MNQIALQTSQITETDIIRARTFGGAMELCAAVAGIDLDKELQLALGVDKGQFARWKNGQEGIIPDKLMKMMDYCGNDAPLLWLLHQRGYDLNVLRKRESELERQLREQTERLAEAEKEINYLKEFVRLR